MTKQMGMGMMDRGTQNENRPSPKVFSRSAQADFFVSVWPVSPLLGLSDARSWASSDDENFITSFITTALKSAISCQSRKWETA
jgi:hypothetical protein